ncbi:L-serine ammonia-lyase, iron-sulfur-dependent, subunit alpha [Klebsiella pneumoniae subsp. pneumoniae]|nr:L-serine ammonia-lyase, iron-sulfur-dependent, subunit alpha [Klebsiella pneumoniae subsp. pneumoniae]
MEHNLGLTCDPVAGQAGAVHRTQRYRCRESGQRRANGAAPDQRAASVCLDKVIETMYETGKT